MLTIGLSKPVKLKDSRYLHTSYTWTMPGDIERYQIDYILIKQRFRNQVKDCRSYPSADINSDHNPVVIKCSLMFKTTKKVTRTDKFNTGKVQDKVTRKLFQKAVRDELVITGESEVCSINDRWTNTKDSILKAAEEISGKETRAAPCRKYRIGIYSDSIRTIPIHSDICIRANVNHFKSIRKTFCNSFDEKR